MKIVITGHTRGVGKYLYDYFISTGHEVIGMSRSNGYDITKDHKKILEKSIGVDLFINNAYNGNSQKDLLDLLKTSVKKIVVMGSVASDYSDIWPSYGGYKLQLENACANISKLNNISLLYLKLSFCENANWDIDIPQGQKIRFEEISDAIEFWLANPRISRIDFDFKPSKELLDHVSKNQGR